MCQGEGAIYGVDGEWFTCFNCFTVEMELFLLSSGKGSKE